MVLNANYVDNYIVDSYAWSRIRVPIADLGFTVATNVSRIIIQLAEYSTYKTFYVDEVRLIGPGKYWKVKIG